MALMAGAASHADVAPLRPADLMVPPPLAVAVVVWWVLRVCRLTRDGLDVVRVRSGTVMLPPCLLATAGLLACLLAWPAVPAAWLPLWHIAAASALLASLHTVGTPRHNPMQHHALQLVSALALRPPFTLTAFSVLHAAMLLGALATPYAPPPEATLENVVDALEADLRDSAQRVRRRVAACAHRLLRRAEAACTRASLRLVRLLAVAMVWAWAMWDGDAPAAEGGGGTPDPTAPTPGRSRSGSRGVRPHARHGRRRREPRLPMPTLDAEEAVARVSDSVGDGGQLPLDAAGTDTATRKQDG